MHLPPADPDNEKIAFITVKFVIETLFKNHVSVFSKQYAKLNYCIEQLKKVVWVLPRTPTLDYTIGKGEQ